jgi:hypothetical protein
MKKIRIIIIIIIIIINGPRARAHGPRPMRQRPGPMGKGPYGPRSMGQDPWAKPQGTRAMGQAPCARAHLGLGPFGPEPIWAWAHIGLGRSFKLILSGVVARTRIMAKCHPQIGIAPS